jgi:isopenicillin-N epimerase
MSENMISTDYRKLFPMTPGAPIYLNSGSHSITPLRIISAVQRYQNEYEVNPTWNLFQAYGKLWRVQEKVAQFFGADPRSMFFRSNVTEVMNEFVQGMPLPSGAEIAITDLEYGAIVNLVQFRCERDGIRSHVIHLPGSTEEIRKLTPELLVKSIVSQFKPETRMFVCSDVVTFNGLMLPLEELARETRKRGILLVVDGAHGPGSKELDFKKLGDVDFYGGNLHKWMLGPKGTSFGWVHPSHHEKLQPLQAGWTTFETASFFESFGGGSRFAGKMLMVGCRDFSPFFALGDLIDFWNELGPEKIRDRIYELQSDLEQKIQALELMPLSPERGKLRGPLLSFELPPEARSRALQLFTELATRKSLQIVVPLMQERPVLRLSPHIYNTPEEHTTAVQALADALRGQNRV